MARRLAIAFAFSSLALSSLALLWPARAAPTTSTAVSSPSGSVIDHIRDLRTPWGGVTLNRYRPYAQPGEEAEAWQPAGATSPPFERWASGGGIWEVVTRYGPGFKMVCTPEMVTPWNDAEHETKATFLADADHLVRGAGYTEDWSGNVMFPSRGNPTGFPKRWHAGVLVEFHTETSTGMHLAIDGLGRAPRFRFGVHDPDDRRLPVFILCQSHSVRPLVLVAHEDQVERGARRVLSRLAERSTRGILRRADVEVGRAPETAVRLLLDRGTTK